MSDGAGAHAGSSSALDGTGSGTGAGGPVPSGDGGRVLLVAVDGREVLGFAGAEEQHHFTGQPQAYLGELVVAPGARRRGVAAALVGAVEEWARSRGLPVVTLDTGAANGPARALYARLGYVEEQVTLTRVLTTPPG